MLSLQLDRYQKRLLLQKSLHYANMYFLYHCGEPLLTTTEIAADDGPFWSEVHDNYEEGKGTEFSKDTAFDDDVCVPLLRVIARVCQSHGTEKLVDISHTCPLWIKQSGEGESKVLASDDLLKAFPTKEEKQLFEELVLLRRYRCMKYPWLVPTHRAQNNQSQDLASSSRLKKVRLQFRFT